MEDHGKAAVLDLLKSWQYTNQYEKIYFLFLHLVLLVLGVYYIRSKNVFRKQLRPVPTNENSAKAIPTNDESVEWANSLATWLMRNGTAVQQAMENLRSKLNGRLLQSGSKKNIQISKMDHSNIEYRIIRIGAQESEMKNEMTAAIDICVKNLTLTAFYCNAENEKSPVEIYLHDLYPKITVQLCSIGGKIKSSFKLAAFCINDSQIEFKNNTEYIQDIELMKESLQAATKDTFVLEIKRGILKKETKPDRKFKENFSENCNKDSPKHILVTDIDTALAKLCSNEMEKSIVKNPDEKLSKLQQAKKSKLHLNITPAINILPATPVTGKIEFDNTEGNIDAFAYLLANSKEGKTSDQCSMLKNTFMERKQEGFLLDSALLKSEPPVSEELQLSSELMTVPEALPPSAVDLPLTGVAGESEIAGGTTNSKESVTEKTSQEAQVLLEISEKDLQVPSGETNEEAETSPECSSPEKVEESSPEKAEDRVEVPSEITKNSPENSPEEGNRNHSYEDSDDVSFDSPSRQVGERKIEPKTLFRPKSICSAELKDNLTRDLSYEKSDNFKELHGKRHKSDINRVNTFHFGSKSMASIVNGEQRTGDSPLRSTASQLSLASPVGYSPSKPSALVIEMNENNKKSYYHIPPAMARKGNYDKSGTKLHVYHGHLFVAQHFSKSSQVCSVCSLPLTRRIGKQGYQCRDCKTITHKRCHNYIKNPCEESSFPSLDIEYLGSTDV